MGDLTADLLTLQRMEMALIRARLSLPTFLSAREYESLRYILSFARLNRWAPLASSAHPPSEMQADPALMTPLRQQVLARLQPALRAPGSARDRLAACLPSLETLSTAIRTTRATLLRQQPQTIAAMALDTEVTRKSLVLMPGGGGGAGFVFVGAFARLQAAGLVPAYVVGASIGALLGGLYARSRQGDLQDLLAWGKSLRAQSIFAPPYMGATRSLPGLLRLHLRALETQLRHADGTPLRLADLEIPYEAVVAGLRREGYGKLALPAPGAGGFSARLAGQLMRVTDYFSPKLLQEIVLGREADTRALRVLDAIGLSAAIPGVLQYEPEARDANSDALLGALAERHGLIAFMDGGVIANVPARVAWEGVQAGRIGTRNAFFLAWDCFHPQWGMGHVWLQPVTQAVQVQTRAQWPYLDWLTHFTPALSPVNLLPGARQLEQAWQWGWEQTEATLPLLQEALRPIDWRP